MPADTYDVIVLGAGAGGMTAAATAATRGCRVLLIEKSPLVGGTTAISGGMVWIPANSKMTSVGLSDPIVNARQYLEQTIATPLRYEMRETFLAHADRAIRYLEANTSVQFRAVQRYPDYYPDLPGATLGGRVLEPVPFDGRELGRRFSVLRPPLPEFTLFGGMMIDRADIPHFRHVTKSMRSAFRVARLVARHGLQRLRNARGTSLVLGNALAARLFQSLLQSGVEVRLNTKVAELLTNGQAVTGVRLGSDGQQDIRARYGVVIATGGFSHNAVMRRRYLPSMVTLSAATKGSAGDGIALAVGAGGVLREGAINNAFWLPVSRFKRRDGSEAIFPHTVTDRSKPGVIAVDRKGRRFTNEARSYHEFVLAMLNAQSDERNPAYLICDRRFLWTYGLGAIKPFALSWRPFLEQGYLHEGRDIAELARKIGIDPDRLTTAVDFFNHEAVEGRDPEFGRGNDAYQRHLGDADVTPNPCVRPIDRPPYYAIAIFPGDLGTAAGLATDRNGQVLDQHDRPIAGLYSCGNDMASVMEGAYPGPGITLGPALTFGFLIAEQLADSRNHAS